MSILNRASDGLASVLVVLVRTLRKKGSMARDKLEALVAPPSLEHVDTGFKKGLQVRQTLNRWVQIGLFQEEDGAISMAKGYEEGPTEGIAGLRALGTQLRQLVLATDNNQGLLSSKPGMAADFTHAVCWMLAQDPFELTSGGYKDLVNQMENRQFSGEPFPFQNDTRWAGFKDWAPLLGFGWNTGVPRANTFLLDPTRAVEEVLSLVFGGRSELPESDFFGALSKALPVVDGGDYRLKVEGRLLHNQWHPTAGHEVSPSLSLSLLRLHESGRLVLESRSDAPYRTLLGQEFVADRRVSHLRLQEVA
jgi:hypothetical protein